MATRTTETEHTTTWGISPEVRSALRAFVLEARAALEDDFRRQLAGLGVWPERSVDPTEELDDEADRARRAVMAVIDRSREAGVAPDDAFETYVQDSAFTFLNRLIGLRCLEERGMLIVEGQPETAIRQDPRLGASSLYFRIRNELPLEAGIRQVWRIALDRAFRAVSERIGLLFDPASEYGQLVPLPATLSRLVEGLNDPSVRSAVWADDEVLGWVYQYYNAEEKDAAYDKLKKGGKLEHPEELAAASCLYTERYMVDFLLQNTLGSIWTEVHPGTSLPESWPYFVDRSRDEAREGRASPERVRDLTLLDPACGSGHFLARAFDLFVEMYREEAIESEAEIPQLILERNLHGLDIDLRAVQISALRLYLKACDLAGPDFRPRRLNLVASDVSLPAAPPQELLHRFDHDRDIRDLLVGIWAELRDAPKLGSLLHPERKVEELVAGRREKGHTLELQDDAAWDRFKLDLLEEIRTEFEKEADADDVGQRLFGQDLAKSIGLVEALTRRYDVVVANPPYTGSKNLDLPVKTFVEREYKDGKRDLYAAFIIRCLEFAHQAGHVGMVTQQSWLFLRSFVKLRERVLTNAAVTTLAHLGAGSFEEISGEVVNVAMFTLQKDTPSARHRIDAFRLVGPKSPGEKNYLLRQAIKGSAPGIVSRPTQLEIQHIPNMPLVYWASAVFLNLLASGPQLGSTASVHDGMTTGDNDRFLRFFWEAKDWGRWRRYAKAGTYRKWHGLHRYVVDWGEDGEGIKNHPRSYVRNEKRYWTEGLTYNLMSRGAMSVRTLSDSAFDPSSISIFPQPAIDSYELLAHLNTHTVSFMLRLIVQGTKFNGGYVSRLPLRLGDGSNRTLGEGCVDLKRRMTRRLAVEWSFDPYEVLTGARSSLLESVATYQARDEVLGALLHSLEGWNERLVTDIYGLDEQSIRSVLDETGTPAGWYPPLAGYDTLPNPPASVAIPDGFRNYYDSLQRLDPSDREDSSVKNRLRRLYEAGPGAVVEDEEDSDEGPSEDEGALGAHIPIPTETFLEELSQKLQLHPVSVYNLAEELRAEGVQATPEVRRLMEDWVSVALLLMLGYRWPEQDRYEAEHGPALNPDLIETDGIVPLEPFDDRPAAAQRLRTLLERRFGQAGAAQSLDEFSTWVGRDLGEWVERRFFPRHIQQFKQRPIAWHLTSPEGTFQALLLYHRLSRETLHRLRDVHAGALINRLRAELQRAEERNVSAAAQELRFKIEDVEEFRLRLTAIEQGRDLHHRIRCRWKGEEEEGRPGPYAPDIDDGVKVNIRPFQDTGLLASEVIKKW